MAQRADGARMDGRRAVRYASFGALDGVVSSEFFERLDQVAAHATNSKAAYAAASVLADVTLFTPAWCAAFLAFMAATRGEPSVLRRTAEQWPELYAQNVAAWLPANTALYTFVPTDLRVAALSIYTVLYTAYLSFFAERGAREGGAADPAQEDRVAVAPDGRDV